MTPPPAQLGFVAIGRNEGERLGRCLASLRTIGAPIVYVDSGSTDGSVDRARAADASVVELPTDQPFTAARARNAGFERLIAEYPLLPLVHFIDGDCELVPGWIDGALAALAESPTLGVVCGRRVERTPDASIYNRLCDIEWDTPVGPAKACGGDALFRVLAFVQVGGFNPAVIAGEEPELCVRLRAAGWGVRRIGHDMTLHDAAITRFSQWWRRTVRAGHAYAQGAALHGKPPERHGVRELRSMLAWSLGPPALALALAWPTRGLSLLVLPLAYGALFVRVARGQRRLGRSAPHARLYAASIVVAKFAMLRGAAKFWLSSLSGRNPAIIEYKRPVTPAPK
ncbi:MAG: glycosyltransferase [Phycisphaerales bacterium]